MIIITYKDNTHEVLHEECMIGYHLTVDTIDDPDCTMIRIVYKNFTNKVIFKHDVRSVVYTFVSNSNISREEESFKREINNY